MQVTNVNCTSITIEDQSLADFRTGSVIYTSVILKVKYNNGTSQNITVLVGDITGSTLTLVPVDLDQTTTTFTEGIYCMELVLTTAIETTSIYGAVLVDCVLKCNIATRMWNNTDSLIYSKYEALKYFLSCNPCDCATSTALYNDLLCDLDMFQNPCGC